jgi:hypothetical protein
MPAIEQKLEKSRLSAEDWALAALDVIAESGLAAVAVEPLARRPGRDQGQLLLAFPLREALLVAALERWEKTEQETVFGRWRRFPIRACGLRELFELVAREPKSHIIYSELLKALDHPVVKPVLSRVSVRRMDYLAASFRQAGLPRLTRRTARASPTPPM